jgi:nicotinamide-nucleotide amidase
VVNELFPKIAVLSVGNELLCGEVVDTNASHIEATLFDHGFRVGETRSVGDDRDAIAEALAALAARSDAVIVTGGLGPTEDDVTAAAAADACGTRVILNPEALAHLAEFARRLKRELHPENERQALLPEGATLFDNPLGTACGFTLRLDEATLYFLPGVPYEMERMLEESVLPSLVRRYGHRGAMPRTTLKLFGLPEADCGALLKELPLPPEVELAYCVRFPELHLILRAPAGCLDTLKRGAALVRERVGKHLFAEDGETMDAVVAALLLKNKATLSLAESCTGGMIAARITSRAGSSAYFLEGAVTYSNHAKSRLLQVPAKLIEAKGAVSAEVACAMASGSRRLSGSTVAVSVTGIAGPDGGSAEKPVGTVFIGLADASRCEAKKCLFPGDRERVRQLTAFTALDLLRSHLISR